LLALVEPFHVAAFVHDLQEELSPPSVKQHLAAIRMLFDWLVTGHVIDTNPAHSVRGPRYTVKKGKTPVLTAEEAHALLESIPTTKKPANDTEAADQPDLLGLRDRALIAIMVYSFARIGAVIQMKVGDYFVQGRRRWVRLHEKGGKEHDVPCHHCLDQCLHESKKTPVTDLFDDQHHEQIPGSGSRNRCVFGLMEERVEFPKQLSTGRKTDVQGSGSL
jgi:site-specific recombinase XerD